MAINDTINFNSTVDYFKLYNHGNFTNNNAAAAATPTTTISSTSTTVKSFLSHSSPPSVTTVSPQSSSPFATSPPPPTTHSIPSLSNLVTTPSTIPLVATIPLTITSKLINNYSTSQVDDDNSTSNYTNSNINNNYFNYTAINSFNQSTLYQYRNLSSNASSDDNNYNDSAKISYESESGSNFMLLLEDFGEYFYNYNGSDYNSSISIYQTNCSLTNSSLCGDINAREFSINLYS